MRKVEEQKVCEGSLAIFWLGQAGFVFKDCHGMTVTIDPYLSDCCERLHGFKRLTPSMVLPEELKTDIIICTHHHADHLDIDAIPIIMQLPAVKLFGSRTSIDICHEMDIDCNKLLPMFYGDYKDLDYLKITAVYADHGDLAPDALGMLLDFNGIKVYYTGDTAYRPDKLKEAIEFKPDIVILPINGQFGNLTPEEAARLTNDVKAPLAIPCHFWTFKEHNGDPQAFDDALKKHSPETEPVWMMQGECFTYKKQL